MESSRLPWIAGLTCVVALILIGLTAGMASAQRPIITTPTPTVVLPPRPQPPAGSVLQPITAGASSFSLPLPLTGTQFSEVDTRAFSYTVQPGDTLWTLAINFGRDLDTMSCATRPRGDDGASLFAGQVITVPALSDLCYTVTPGDTLANIAAGHGLTVQQIAAVPWNDLTRPYRIEPRQRMLLPGARPWAPPRPSRELIYGVISVPDDQWAHSPWPEWPYGDGHFIWPVAGAISQGFHPGHRAVDIATPAGTPVRAADRGTVIMAGWSSTGYGFRVVIDHHIDYVTLYAHMNDIYVQEGQVVAKGQIIGITGANGNVTGPHLHFEIRDFGVLIDPLQLLPK